MTVTMNIDFLVTIMCLGFILVLAIIRHMGNRVNALLLANDITIKRMDFYKKVFEYSTKGLALSLKHAYTNGTKEEQDKISQLVESTDAKISQ